MNNKEFSIIIPCKGESKNLEYLLPRLKKISAELIVVDANSNDGSKEICLENDVKYIIDDGKGKGSAQRIAVNIAKFDNIIFFDGDGAPDIKDIELLNSKLNDGFDLIICSRQTGGSYDLDFNSGFKSAIRASGVIFLVVLFNKLFNQNFTDILYSFKGINKKKFIELHTTENGFAIEIEILIKSIKKNLKILEVPSRENKRKFGKSKLPTIGGLYFIYYILKEGFLQFDTKKNR